MIIWLVVTGTCFIFPYIGIVIIKIDELIFFRGVETTNQLRMMKNGWGYTWFNKVLMHDQRSLFFVTHEKKQEVDDSNGCFMAGLWQHCHGECDDVAEFTELFDGYALPCSASGAGLFPLKYARPCNRQPECLEAVCYLQHRRRRCGNGWGRDGLLN